MFCIILNCRHLKRSHHSYEFNQPEMGITNATNKAVCNEEYYLELYKTWLNITKSIQDIEQDLKRIRQGFVTLSNVPKQINVRMHNIDNALTGIQSAITFQQKLTSFEYPLGDILDGKKVGLSSNQINI